jgi:hypothetical protein
LTLQFANGTGADSVNLIRGVMSEWIYIIRGTNEEVYGHSLQLTSLIETLVTFPRKINVKNLSYNKFIIRLMLEQGAQGSESIQTIIWDIIHSSLRGQEVEPIIPIFQP